MDLRKIEELIKVLESSRTEEISVRKGDMAVHIKKGRKPKPSAAKAKSDSGANRPAAADSDVSRDHYILAPMVGVFHAVDGIAKVGSKVTAGQVVGTIESMKLLNDVVSELTGTVEEAMVEDGTPVEYGQPLCKVEPV